MSLRNLVLVLGDQLDESSSAFVGFDPQQDAIWMAEVEEESTHVMSSKQRTTLFLSAMRHFAKSLQAKEWPVLYTALDSPKNAGSLASELEKTILLKKPQHLIMVMPVESRVLTSLQQNTPNSFLLVWGVIPSLLGWISLLLGSVNGLLILAATLWLCFVVDYKIYPKFGLQHWMSMRFILTAVASTSIALSVIFST